MGEWLKPADCKSAAPCGLRRFESFPVHQDSIFASGKFAGGIARSALCNVVAATPQDNRSCDVRRRKKTRRLSRSEKVRRETQSVFGGSGSAWVAQLVERVLGKDEVTGSIPVPGSRFEVRKKGGGNSTVESHSSKVMVAGSNPVPRSKVLPLRGFCRAAEGTRFKVLRTSSRFSFYLELKT